MSTNTYKLPDGTALEEWDGSDPPRGIDAVTGRTGTYDAARAALVDGPKVIREIAAHAATRPMPKAASRRRATRGHAADRFATLNSFVDAVARHLTAVEIAVWVILFRDCRGGQVTASNRDLVRRSGCSLRAVTAAVKRLRSIGLIEAVKLSRHKGEPSVYALHPMPDRCVPKLIDERPRTGADNAPVQEQQAPEPVQQMHRIEK
jgi:hypothetical protein